MYSEEELQGLKEHCKSLAGSTAPPSRVASRLPILPLAGHMDAKHGIISMPDRSSPASGLPWSCAQADEMDSSAPGHPNPGPASLAGTNALFSR